MLNERGEVANGYFGEDIYRTAPFIRYAFLTDQARGTRATGMACTHW